ncbi:DUF2877 domain-containing protein [Jiangella asiatica]|uniref:DUF2877 domain-containing protein n=1 Tax=Jiangella asiatica TaxID=2530372 RepID=A0A4R5CNH4_9ACTN|nr:DUF2877 domain-containing protein [Jiangella asiatica]TDE00281.1 DUF2877 domain-containing protein [Jiangella asiatica]
MPVSTAPDLAPAVRTPMPGAASTAVASLVGGPRLAGEVVASTRGLLAAVVGGELVSVTGTEAARLPCSVVTVSPPPPARVGAPVTAGGGSIVVDDGVIVTAVRWWRPRPARLPDAWLAAGRAVRARRPHLDPVVGAAADRLGTALSAAGDLDHAVRGLLGLGPGLTPAGDDVLAGALVTLAALGEAQRLDTAVRAARPFDRTTAVSAGLFAHAARGLAVPELADLVRALGTADADVDGARRALFAVGHTSGAALYLGVLTALSLAGRAP